MPTVPYREFRLPMADGVNLQVAEWGAPTAELTVVLAHGWTLSNRIWEDVAQSVVAADSAVRVIAYDHRGHGLSDRVPEASIEELADDLGAVITALVPTGPVVLGGHSLGGFTLTALAERHPDLVVERVEGAMLVATSAGELMGAVRRIPGTEATMKFALRLGSRVKMPSRPLFLVRQECAEPSANTRGGATSTEWRVRARRPTLGPSRRSADPSCNITGTGRWKRSAIWKSPCWPGRGIF